MPPLHLDDIAKYAAATTNEVGRFVGPVSINQVSASAKHHLSDLFESAHALSGSVAQAAGGALIMGGVTHNVELALGTAVTLLTHSGLGGKISDFFKR